MADVSSQKKTFNETIHLSSEHFIEDIDRNFLQSFEKAFDVEARFSIGSSGADFTITAPELENLERAQEAINLVSQKVSKDKPLSALQYGTIFKLVKEGKDILVSHPESVGIKNPKFQDSPKVQALKGFSPAKNKIEKIARGLGLKIEKQDDDVVNITLLDENTSDKEQHMLYAKRINIALETLQELIENKSLSVKDIAARIEERVKEQPELSPRYSLSEQKKEAPSDDQSVTEIMNEASALLDRHLHLRRFDKPDQSVHSFSVNDIEIPNDAFLSLFRKQFNVEIEFRQGKDDSDIFIGAKSQNGQPDRAISILSTFLNKNLPQNEQTLTHQVDPLVAVRSRYEDGHEAEVNRISSTTIPRSVLNEYADRFNTEIVAINGRYYIFGDTEVSIKRTEFVLQEKLQPMFVKQEYAANLKEAKRLASSRLSGLRNEANDAEKKRAALNTKITNFENSVETLEGDSKKIKQFRNAKSELPKLKKQLPELELKANTVKSYRDSAEMMLREVEGAPKEINDDSASENIKALDRIIELLVMQQNADRIYAPIEQVLTALDRNIVSQEEIKSKDPKDRTEAENAQLSYDYNATRSEILDTVNQARSYTDLIKKAQTPDDIEKAHNELLKQYSEIASYLSENDANVSLKKYSIVSRASHRGLLRNASKSLYIREANEKFPTETSEEPSPERDKSKANDRIEATRKKEEAKILEVNQEVHALKASAKPSDPVLYHSKLGCDLSQLAEALSHDKSQKIAREIFQSSLGIWIEPVYVERSGAWGLVTYEPRRMTEKHKAVRDGLLRDLSSLAGGSQATNLTPAYVSRLVESKFVEESSKKFFQDEIYGVFCFDAAHDFFNQKDSNQKDNAEMLSVFEAKTGLSLKLHIVDGRKGFSVHLPQGMDKSVDNRNLQEITDIGHVLSVIEERLKRARSNKNVKQPTIDEIRGWLNNPKGSYRNIEASAQMGAGFAGSSTGANVNGNSALSASSEEGHYTNIVIPQLSEKDAAAIANIPPLRPFVPLRRPEMPEGEKSSQERLIANFSKNDVVFALGPAATGKTFTAIDYLVRQLISGNVNRIVIGRPAIEAGERLGFLPGDAKDKLDPYLRPIYDAFHEVLGQGDMENGQKILNDLIQKKIVEISPLAFMRGRTFKKAGVYIDEAQNASYMQLKTILTRLGQESQMILGGDESQDDLREFGLVSGLLPVSKMFDGVKGFGVVHMDPEDATARHKLLLPMVRKFDEHERGVDALTLGNLKFEDFVLLSQAIEKSRKSSADLNAKFRGQIAEQTIRDAIRKASYADRMEFLEALGDKEGGALLSAPDNDPLIPSPE